MDDVRTGGMGYNHLLPIAGLKIYVIRMEDNFAYYHTTTQGVRLRMKSSTLVSGEVKLGHLSNIY